ncbi:hypothetical protein C5S35_17330 [Candidatus Methanophagaceae archaeon]|nr:hypothetical protein C5S35_17330 [Methanophagales archaeon]
MVHIKNIFFKNFGESVYEEVKDSTEKVKEEGITKEENLIKIKKGKGQKIKKRRIK